MDRDWAFIEACRIEREALARAISKIQGRNQGLAWVGLLEELEHKENDPFLGAASGPLDAPKS